MKRFKKVLALLMAVIMTIGAVNLPAKEAKAAEEVTLSFNRSGIRAEDYIIYLNGLTAEQVNAIGSGGLQFNCINIDGKKSTAYGYNVGGEIAIIAPFNQFNGATAAADVGRHFITIPKGSTIGSGAYTVAEDYHILIDGSRNPAAVTGLVSLGYKRSGTRAEDYITYLSGLTADQVNAISSGGINTKKSDDILVDGTVKNDPYFYNVGGELAFLVNYSHLKTGATSAANITEDHTVTIRKGTMIGTYSVDRDYVLKFNGSTVTPVLSVDSSATLSMATAATRADLILLKVAEIQTPFVDVHFEKYDSTAIYQYNGVDSKINMFYSNHGGIYAEVAGMSGVAGKTTPDEGDVITIGGKWRYLGDRKVYDFGSAKSWTWMGDHWEEGRQLATTKPTMSVHASSRYNLLIASIAEITVPGSDVFFHPYDDNYVCEYYDASTQTTTSYGNRMTMSSYGGIYIDTPGSASAGEGDTITIGGIWKYDGDNKYYDFGTSKFEWNGSKWQVYVEKTPLTLTWGTTNVAQDKTANGAVMARYLMYPNGPTAEQIAALHGKWITIYVDGVAVPSGAQFYNADGTLLFLLPYNKLESNVTEAANLKDHEIQIKAGTVIGSYYLANDYTFHVQQYTIEEGNLPTYSDLTLT